MEEKNNINELIENAVFGDWFVTRNGKEALFLRRCENLEFKMAEFYVKDWGVVRVFENNGKFVGSPHDEEYERDIVGKWGGCAVIKDKETITRTIKFRGFCEEDWQWHYGDLLTWCNASNMQIKDWHTEDFKEFDVVDITVGQYTGVEDKNGVQVFEDDVVHCLDQEYVVAFNKDTQSFVLVNNQLGIQPISSVKDFEVVGVIFSDYPAPEMPVETPKEEKRDEFVVVDIFGRYLSKNLYRWVLNKSEAKVFENKEEAKESVPSVFEINNWRVVEYNKA